MIRPGCLISLSQRTLSKEQGSHCLDVCVLLYRYGEIDPTVKSEMEALRSIVRDAEKYVFFVNLE